MRQARHGVESRRKAAFLLRGVNEECLNTQTYPKPCRTIGILSSVVLVSLNSARSKGQAARVQEEVSQLRTQFESDYSNGLYSPTCTAAVGYCTITTDATGAATAGGTWGANSTNYVTLAKDIYTQNTASVKVTGAAATVAGSQMSGYAIYGAQPGTSPTTYFCIDSGGNTKTASAGPATTVTAVNAIVCQ
jgi:type II secretory pathway pseudopilin PulG